MAQAQHQPLCCRPQVHLTYHLERGGRISRNDVGREVCCCAWAYFLDSSNGMFHVSITTLMDLQGAEKAAFVEKMTGPDPPTLAFFWGGGTRTVVFPFAEPLKAPGKRGKMHRKRQGELENEKSKEKKDAAVCLQLEASCLQLSFFTSSCVLELFFL